MLNILVFLFFTFPASVFLGFFVFILRIIGQVKVLHRERQPYWKRKLIIISNHPSLLETVILPAFLFFPQAIFNPFFYIPWSTPDKKNFYDKWYWFWIRPVSIPINRRNHENGARTLYDMVRLLEKKKILIIFAEGGRTFRGTEFEYSEGGKRMRPLENTVGWLIRRTQAHVLPIWVEGTDKVLLNHPTKLFAGINWRERVTIKVGNVMQFKPTKRIGSAKQIIESITQALLNLADE